MSRQLGIELKRSKYRLLGLVGQGQFGRVFCAVHRQTGQLVALKELEQQRFPTHKFLRELRFLLSLQHPNIVTCWALEHTATGRYLVMDYCEGGTLRSLMSEDNHLSLPHSIKLIADILAGLDHAHSRDIVHCDIKPENILLNVEPTGWIARISDFGVARLSQELSDQDFGNTGSPAYMAPERFYGQYSRTSDLYAVGILLFELIAGHRPFSGTPAHLMSAHLNQPVKIPDTVPDVWHPLIITALQKLSARRFRSAGEMLGMLRSIAATDESSAGLPALPIAPPLFQSTLTLPPAPFQSQHQEELQQPIVALVGQSLPSPHSPPDCFLLYQATADRVACRSYRGINQTEDEISRSAAAWNEISHAKPIEFLWLRPQGCFVGTQRSLHLITPAGEPDSKLVSLPVLELHQNYRAAIDDRGRWLATLTTAATAETSTMTLWQLGGNGQTVRLNSVELELPSPATVELSTLGPHHIAVVFDQVMESKAESEATELRATQPMSRSVVKVLTRRGTPVGTLHLPVQIGQLTSTATPYQLLAIDRHNPRSILLIDLKPYRILRIGIAIEPAFLLVTSWGYVAANAEGKIVCLDRELRSIGQLLAPSAITAIAAINPYALLVATWENQQGHLHSLDLREAGLELLF